MQGDKVPTSILDGPTPASARARLVDFSDTEFEGAFALVIDDILTTKECQDLITLVEPADNTPWPAAGIIGYKGPTQNVSYRKCGRIIHRSAALADALLRRIMPFLPPHVVTLDSERSLIITGPYPVVMEEKWKISRLREDMRFLKYEPGGYFRPHRDSQYTDGKRSFLTVHVYLNHEGLEGGATSFLVDDMDLDGGNVDVNPKAGSVLVFQQENMLHEGAIVTKGVKYTVRTDVLYEKTGKNIVTEGEGWSPGG
jgi:hypothetical protein